MLTITLEGPADIAGWRRASARLDGDATPPEAVLWRIGDALPDLFAPNGPGPSSPPPAAIAPRPLPRALEEILDDLLLHSDPQRFALAYRLLHRTRDMPELMEIASDPDVMRAGSMAKAVRRDRHKMKAFVRFRTIDGPAGETMVAWHEPDHHITASAAPFFMRRFATMRWSILTPEASAHWDLEKLTIGPGAAKSDAPDGDALEDYWRTYYASIFNPARLKVKAMKKEMPVKFWRNLPEAELIQPLIRAAEARVREMQARAPTPARLAAAGAEATMQSLSESVEIPGGGAELNALAELKPALDGCRRCPLYATATQGVPGEGPTQADIMFVGEQPGDQEDLAGQPFVGPAGKLFNIALERAGVDRARAYVTNAVKHFKFEPRGKRRIHAKPNAGEIEACSWWIEREIRLVRPKLIVALGATAAFSVTGKAMPVQQNRSVVIAGADWPADRKRPAIIPAGEARPSLLMTVHPSFLLRLQAEEDKRREWHAFLSDLRLAKDHADRLAA